MAKDLETTEAQKQLVEEDIRQLASTGERIDDGDEYIHICPTIILNRHTDTIRSH